MTRKTLAAAFALVGLTALVACEPLDPCDDYVDYICECHSADEGPEYDCQTLRNTYQNADPDLQDECAIALSDETASAGGDCRTASDTGI